MGETNILNNLPNSASNLYAKNMFNFIVIYMIKIIKNLILI